MEDTKETKENNHKTILGMKHWVGVSLFLVFYDMLAVSMSYFLALWFRFDCRYSQIPEDVFKAWLYFTPFYIIFCIIVFNFLRLYRSIWRFASYNEMTRCIWSSVITGSFHIIFITIIFRRMPISYYCIGTGLQFLIIMSIRFSYRFILLLRRVTNADKIERGANVMVIGAGNAGQMLIRDIHSSAEIGDKVVCIIDDNSNKWKRYIDGIPVVGGRDSILESVKKYKVEKIYLALPSASMAERRDILNICQETGCEMKNLPGMYQIVNGEVSVSNLKHVSIDERRHDRGRA